MTRRGRLARAAAVALLASGLGPAAASAQVFIASKPHPEFWIAPLLITANVEPKDVAGNPGPLTPEGIALVPELDRFGMIDREVHAPRAPALMLVLLHRLADGQIVDDGDHFAQVLG